MTDQPLRITTTETRHQDDRFHRLRLIEWWDQNRLSQAKVLVIGAGALGNEIVKNLALLGIGHLLIADLDRIENSNLSRSVLYREADNGRYKAEVAAQAARHIYPHIRAAHFVGNVVHDLGLGAFRWADLVVGGLDNREARLAINRRCYLLGRPWIDGAIEQIQGTARVFIPDGPCYECTLSKLDWELLNRRRSCNLLSRAEMESGRTPTTPTISSIIAGVQCQEAVKLLHNLPVIGGRGWVFQGLGTEAWQVEFQRRDDCLSHEPLDEVVPLDVDSTTFTVRQLLDDARKLLGPNVQLELARDVLEKLVCPHCKAAEPLFMSLGKVRAEQAVCPQCQGRRQVETFYRIRGDEPFLDRPLERIGIPPFDIILARSDDRFLGLEISGDAPRVLGPLLATEEDVEWT
jgi:adenylyltransferase/sulfurtransferase